MILSIQEARDAVRAEEYHDPLIIPLLEAIPSYLETTTGRNWDTEPVHPLAKTAAKFILMLWFDPQEATVERLKNAIDNLLVALTAMGRTLNNDSK